MPWSYPRDTSLDKARRENEKYKRGPIASKRSKGPSLASSLRELEADQRRREREWVQSEREQARQEQARLKAAQEEAARRIVTTYQTEMGKLLSLHQRCSAPHRWDLLAREQPPAPPVIKRAHEAAAIATRNAYRPTFFDRIFKREGQKRQELEAAIEVARNRDEQALGIWQREYESQLAEWGRGHELAEHIVAGDGYRYIDALREVAPLAKFESLSSGVEVVIETSKVILVDVRAENTDALPSDTYSLLKSGKLSVKPMTKTAYHALYRDHICSLLLRVTREIFALLPIETLIISASVEQANLATGIMERATIVSVIVSQETLGRIEFATLQPYEAVKGLDHRMAFVQTKGFNPVEAFTVQDLVVRHGDR